MLPHFATRLEAGEAGHRAHGREEVLHVAPDALCTPREAAGRPGGLEEESRVDTNIMLSIMIMIIIIIIIKNNGIITHYYYYEQLLNIS